MSTRKHFPTRNDLPEKTRTAMIDVLNQQLADATDLRTQIKHAHWNVKGPTFIALHELFDKLAAEVAEQADEIAERATALGGVALGTLRLAAAATRIAEFPHDAFSGEAVVTALADRFAAWGKTLRAGISTADELGDADTADLLTGISREVDLRLWFLEAHLSNPK